MAEGAPLVGVSGQIAAGKSTLTRGLASHLGFEPILEDVERNPYLARYYHEPAAWAMHNFFFFFEQSLTDQVHALAASRGVVQERLPQEHLEVFAREFHARGFLSDDDMALLERLADTVLALVEPPVLLVHLDASPNEALRRLRARAREAESGVPLEYLRALDSRYNHFIAQWDVSPVVRIDTSEVDVRSADGIAHVAELVAKRLPADVA